MTHRIIALAIGLTVAASPAAAQAPRDQHEAHRLHQDPKAYVAALDDPRRDAYQKPAEVIAALGVKAGDTVADIGAGSGYFALRLAEAVGAGGRVYAVDVSPDMVRHLNARVRDAKLANVSTILAPPDDPLLPVAVDLVLIVNVWHHIDDQASYLAQLKRALEPGGRLVMIDFHKREMPVGPPVAMKIAREDLLAQMTTHGFGLTAEHTFLPHQYFLVFEAK